MKYRGYVLTEVEGRVDIAFLGEHIDWADDFDDAKQTIDFWLSPL
jgi:hypothetical protein